MHEADKMGRITTERVIEELKKLKKYFSNVYEIDKMLLFGSRARNDELFSSDVDVIVVSNDFKSIPFKQRPDKFLDNWKLPIDLEIICYSPQEFKRKLKEYGIVRQANKDGILI